MNEYQVFLGIDFQFADKKKRTCRPANALNRTDAVLLRCF